MNFARSRLRDWLLYAVAAQNEQVGNEVRVRKYDIHFQMLLSRSRFPDEDVPLPSCGFR